MLNQIQSTASFTIIFLNVSALALFFFLWNENSNKYDDMRYFFISILFCTIGGIGMYLIDYIPHTLDSVFFMTTIVYNSFLLIGFQKYYKEKLSYHFFIILAYITIFLSLYVPGSQNNTSLYIISICIYTIIMWKLITFLFKHRNVGNRINIVFAIILLLQFSLFTAYFVIMRSISSLQRMSLLYNYLSLIMPVSKTFSLFLIVHMINRRRKIDADIQDKMIRNVFMQSSEGITVTTIEGNILRVNDEFCKITGYSREELLGMNVTKLDSSEDAKDIKRIYNNAKKSISDVNKMQLETKILRKDNSIVWVLLSSSLVKDLNNTPLYYISNIVNFDEIKRKNLEIELSEQKLRIANQEIKELSNAKSDFLAIVSHETRTPLTTMLGITHLLKNTDLSKVQTDLIKKIENAGNTLLHILNDILDMSKCESGKQDLESKPFNFLETLDSTLSLYKTKAEMSGNSMSYDISSNIPDFLVGDLLRLTQVISNILGNSIKFTNNGHIDVTIKLVGRTLDYADLEIIIRDTGIGMTNEQIKKLFKPFEQANSSITRKYGGTGLGMAISKQLIEAMDGDIQVSSTLGIGTVFKINLGMPIASKDSVNDLKNDTLVISKDLLSELENKKVLIVEDHIINQEILCSILKNYKLDIDTSNNGMEALKKTNNIVYDLILMDFQMPIMDGLTATKKIKNTKNNKNRSTPIVAMTAQAMQTDLKSGMAAGMDGYLTKPIDIPALEHALVKHLVTKDISPHGKDFIRAPYNNPKGNSVIPVFDAQVGLMRFNNNKELYKQTIDEFLSYKSTGTQIQRMLLKKNFKEAKILAHSMKGLAANLSFEKLYKSALSLEEKISSAAEDVYYDVQILTEHLCEVINGIENKDFHKIIDAI